MGLRPEEFDSIKEILGLLNYLELSVMESCGANTAPIKTPLFG